MKINQNNFLNEVFLERTRQVNIERFDEEHDKQNINNELLDSAAVYLLTNNSYELDKIMQFWPVSWDKKWFKPTTKRRNLVKAVALILAEIDRMDNIND